MRRVQLKLGLMPLTEPLVPMSPREQAAPSEPVVESPVYAVHSPLHAGGSASGVVMPMDAKPSVYTVQNSAAPHADGSANGMVMPMDPAGAAHAPGSPSSDDEIDDGAVQAMLRRAIERGPKDATKGILKGSTLGID